MNEIRSDTAPPKLRRAVQGDAQAIGAVFDAAVRAGWTYLGDLAAEPMFAAEDWEQLVADHQPPKVLLVAVDETDGVVGYTAVHPENGEMFLLFVHPAHAGRGIGRALLAAAHDALRAAGCTEAYLFVHEQNERALAVYRAAGYRPDGSDRVSDFRGTDISRIAARQAARDVSTSGESRLEPADLSGLAALEAVVEGPVVPRDSPDLEALRKPAWAQFEHIAPEAVVLCLTAADVAETITFARRAGAEIGARSGGHCFAGRSSTRGILIDLSEMRSVSVADGLATVEAGALLGDVYERLDSDGLTIPAGACPSVGIAGLTLGGGFGILGRRYGLTSDQLVGARVVLADGRVVDCDEHREPDLFWALRGAGGGQFGIVTTFLLRTVPAQHLTCFRLDWPYAQAAAAVELWQDWAPDASDELAASLLVTASGDLDEPVVTIFGAMLGTETETTDTLDHLIVRLSADPVSTKIKQLPHRAAKTFLAEHAPGAERSGSTTPLELPRPSMMFAKSEFFRRPLPPDVIAALVDSFVEGRGTGQARELDFTPWSGAYNRTRTDATAFAHRNERFLLKHAVVLDADAAAHERDTARDWLARSWSIVHPHGSGGVYPSFPDPDLTNWARAYHDANYERLSHVKAHYDRDNLFRFHQSLRPI